MNVYLKTILFETFKSEELRIVDCCLWVGVGLTRFDIDLSYWTRWRHFKWLMILMGSRGQHVKHAFLGIPRGRAWSQSLGLVPWCLEDSWGKTCFTIFGGSKGRSLILMFFQYSKGQGMFHDCCGFNGADIASWFHGIPGAGGIWQESFTTQGLIRPDPNRIIYRIKSGQL